MRSGRSFFACASSLLVCFCLASSFSAASFAASSAQTEKEKTKAVNARDSVTKKLSELQKKITEQEAQTEQAHNALQKADQAISEANKRLRTLKGQRTDVEKRLRELKQNENQISKRIDGAENLVSLITRAQYINSRQKSWQSFINGSNPNTQNRRAAELRYLARAQQRAIQSLVSEQNHVQSLAKESLSKKNELIKISKEEESSKKTLLTEQRERQIALQKLQKELQSQQSAIAKLQKDQARLSDLVTSIDKKLEQQRKLEAQKAQKLAQSQKKNNQKPIPPVKGGNFAKLKGQLTRPVQGPVIASFGSRRNGSAKWQGIVIKAQEGSEVKACAAGTIVFADWLRGYGNLIIIDHGNTYMSVYANNESILKNVGDKVKAGNTISTVGQSGTSDNPGLYFEIRYKGKPINPLPWLKK